ncbi:RES family NAD+ phosphorylase [Sinomonas halotolerans]|uniref:RES family NAD+ phosphorylase n=1 Tax=Sinomonas halotolerans TaxID=1644133 RepID=A0ABU9WW09_9MICC
MASWGRQPGQQWQWCRIWHPSGWAASGSAHRGFGPIGRMDHHVPAPDGQPRQCPEGRTVLYAAESLATALGEVFGEAGEVAACPRYRVCALEPEAPLPVLDLRSEGAAMRIGALPSLATGPYPRSLTQEWARAVYEDQPAEGVTVRGILYNAAYSNGGALALWDTDGEVTVPHIGGMHQDFALQDPQMWRRVLVEADRIGMPAAMADPAACPRCRQG